MTPYTDEALSIHAEPVRSNSWLMRFGPWLAVAAFILVGVLRIVSTYHVFNEVFDEPPHIAAGMQWWQEGTYNYERKHTPLARAAVALPLYIRGIRGQNLPDMIDEGHQILYERDQYYTNLAWARSGNLPFFILSNILIFLWARRWWGPWTGVAAVGLFSALPPILAHAAIATTDIGAVCGLIATVYSFCVWLEKPDLKRTLILGIALALAMLVKLSVVPFFAIGAGVTLAWAAWRRLPVGIWAPVPITKQIRNIAVTVVVAALVIWAPYHFRLAAMSTGHGYRPPTASLGHLGRIVDYLLDAKLPLGEFLGGVGSVATFNKLGYMAFFEGAYRTRGWWIFFTPPCAGNQNASNYLAARFGRNSLSFTASRRRRMAAGSAADFRRGRSLVMCDVEPEPRNKAHPSYFSVADAGCGAGARLAVRNKHRQSRGMGILAVLLVAGFASRIGFASASRLSCRVQSARWFQTREDYCQLRS